MGSEQSSQANPSQALRLGQLRRGKSVPESKRAEQESMDTSRPGSISPGPSVCSDSDLPYISYTVNRPIGDSPKLPAKQQGQLSRGKSLGAASGLLSSPGRRVGLRKPSATRPAPPSPAHNIVVVKPAATQETADKDVDILRLQSIPMFLPIMRGTLTLPAARDPEVLERLDPGALYHLCLHYQNHLNHCAQLVADDQAIITHRIKEEVRTRWNSTYYMIQTIVDSKDAVKTTVSLINKDIPIWEICSELITILGPFEEVIQNSGEHYLMVATSAEQQPIFTFISELCVWGDNVVGGFGCSRLVFCVAVLYNWEENLQVLFSNPSHHLKRQGTDLVTGRVRTLKSTDSSSTEIFFMKFEENRLLVAVRAEVKRVCELCRIPLTTSPSRKCVSPGKRED
ncbi:hypothetical protein J6590_074746 [Homalodisca vitripennis]|nr:hypothetical protein J6590_074746 [Homalodisca vitripennis]